MPDPIPGPSPKPATNPLAEPSASGPSSSAPSISGPTINIGDEFGTAKRNLPPVKILLLAIAAVLVIVAIASFLRRAKPQAAGSVDHISAVALPGQTATMVALTFTLKNGEKTLYVYSIRGKLKTPTEEFTAEAVSAIDFDRYFQAFPSLKEGAQTALAPETKLQPGEAVTRTAIVVFPVSLNAFSQRQAVSVVIQPYDQQVAIVMTR